MHRRLRLKIENPVLLIIGCQSVAAIAGYFLIPVLNMANPWPGLVLQGALASLLGVATPMSRWWMPFQVLLPAGVVLALSLEAPYWLWPTLFVVSLLVFWNSAGGRVPLYLSNNTTWAALKDLMADKPNVRFIDLGCGLGGTTQYLARHLPDGEFTGVETAPLPFVVARLRNLLSGLGNVRISYASLWDQDLSEFDLVYAFLSPAPMLDLYAKAQAEMKPGSRFISNSFDVPGHPADQIIKLDDARHTHLHVWNF
ncbi:MAG: class I SAM-dependent methyltransferase [Rhodospirillaceae bacterium]|jgi:SAM-dependent methyltransferase|nr:class I SAM-dependent methyltransferase [Rhodospirillaceae bacterium]MBT4463921.1 class I SAM-dependent methyltransferase [Rhodospirillaceae bacterium]MBT5014674.1 class I SAM-dependent methyltransferase [Rhodospirillaceae bacterium]MBT5308246.1 class I SAM-dependent methyltransferase [Rhodospirillaceae bacterium]MBT7354775.1 class I SAM-dependent methyltransferase [Rhodospirillaceae bacterium]